MLFPSNEFLVLFLPISLVVFLILRRFAGATAVIWFLLLASLFFYSSHNPYYAALILGSMTFNYVLGWICVRGITSTRLSIAIGVSGNLSVLVWFKYSFFLSQNLSGVLGVALPAYTGDLPLAVSFFTFLQIAYLVDVCTSKKTSGGILEYFLFVSFFPHLIAGPLVHHRELIPQFRRIQRDWRSWQISFAVGLTIFAVGLFKKVGVADTIAPMADFVFDGAQEGRSPTLISAWLGVISYALQIYYDFSGYSDMAIGLSKMFCLRLPINFNSPYRAGSIIDFWKRWHITLSRFLRDYLYIPLGGNRRGTVRRFTNLMFVMLLGGLWHGAGWKFAIWGGLHGFYLVVNHAWRWLLGDRLDRSRCWSFVSWGLTITAVTVAWVPFRAADVATSLKVWSGMAGANGVELPRSLGFLVDVLPGARIGAVGSPMASSMDLAVFAAALLVAIGCPNVYQVVRRGSPVLDAHIDNIGDAPFQWSPTLPYAFAVCGLILYCFMANQFSSPFLYFQF